MPNWFGGKTRREREDEFRTARWEREKKRAEEHLVAWRAAAAKKDGTCPSCRHVRYFGPSDYVAEATCRFWPKPEPVHMHHGCGQHEEAKDD